MGYSLSQITEVLSRTDKTLYKIGDIAYQDMFSELNEALDYERDIIFIYKKSLEWADDFYVGDRRTDAIVERLALKIYVYDYGLLNPVYSDIVSSSDIFLSGFVPTSRMINTTSPLMGGGSLASDLTLSMPSANTTTSGYLTSTDWNIFNSKQGAITLTTTGTSGVSTFIGNILNIPNYTTDLSGYVPTSRTLTINGVTYDLSANRSWTISSGTVTSVGLSMPSAFSVANSPVTSSGVLTVTGAGTTAQYIRGDGTLQTFPTTISSEDIIKEVYNESGATMVKGTVIYINGSHGNLPTIAKALATGDSTSAQTLGMVQNDITNMNNGYIVIIGSLIDLDTQAYLNGTQLYLSPTTAGEYTSTKQYAPNHLVYVGIVVRSHPTQGIISVKVQNGYEMDEIHNVSAQSPANNDGLFYNTTTSLWEKKSIDTVLGYTPEAALTFSSPLSRSVNTISIPVATTSVNGYLSSSDWTTFNGKYNLPSLTNGSVLFSNGTTIAQDIANFFWDDTNNRLGIGTNSPANALDVNGTTRLQGATTISTGNFTVSSGNSAFNTSVPSPLYASSQWVFYGSSGVLESSSTQTKFLIRNNAYFTTSEIRKVTGYAQMFALDTDGSFNFTSAGTAAAGTTITFVDKMKLFNNGNLLLQNGGTFTDAGYRLDVSGTGRFTDNLLVSKSQAAYTGIIISNGQNAAGSAVYLSLESNVLSGNFQVGKYSTNTTTYKTLVARDGFIVNTTSGDISILNDFATGKIKFAGGGSSTVQLEIASNGTLTSSANATAASAIARGANITPTLVAAANNDVLVGMDITPTFTNGAFTGVTNLAARFQDNVKLEKSVNGTLGINIVNSNAGTSTLSEIGVSNGSSGFSMTKAGTNKTAYKILSANDGYLYNGTGNISILSDAASSIIKFAAGSSTASQMTLFSNGNLGIGVGITDAGYKLDVSGTARVQGQTIIGAGNSKTGLRVGDNGLGRYIEFGYNNSSSVFSASAGSNGFLTGTSIGIIQSDKSFGVNGEMRSITVSVGVAQDVNMNASSKVQIDSTTQGFLPPRMTNAQVTAITTPATGLLAYATDATEGMYVKLSGAWQRLLTTGDGTGAGTVTSVAALTLGTAGTDLSSTVATSTTTPVITLNVPTASATNRGVLSSADWTTFNGKFTLPALTNGSVLFSNGTTISQNNGNFFWDNANQRLGIGTASPSAIFHSVGTVSSASLIGRGAYFNNTITATANNDVLVGLDINPTFTNGAFTGVSNIGLRVTGTASISSSITANSIIKSGGTSSQFLKADGSVDSTTYGTFTLPSFTNGSVLFSNGTTIAQDNAQFYWDDTNNRLGIGTITPANDLHIKKSADVGGKFESTNSSNEAFVVLQNSSSEQANLEIFGAGFGVVSLRNSAAFTTTCANGFAFVINNSSATSNFSIKTTTSLTERFRLFNSTGNVVIQNGGTFTDAGYRLDVTGTSRLNGSATFGTSGSGTGMFWDNTNNRLLIGTATAYASEPLQVNGSIRANAGSFVGGGTNIRVLDTSGYSNTGSSAVSAINIDGTWNTTGNPTLIFTNITNTGSGATSKLIDLQVGSASKFYIDKNGGGYISSRLGINTTPGASFQIVSNDAFNAAGGITMTATYAQKYITTTSGATLTGGFGTEANVLYMTFGGTNTIDNATQFGVNKSVIDLAFSATGTVTSSPAGIRAINVVDAYAQTSGSVAGTITHLANIRSNGVYPSNATVITVSNFYGLLLNPSNYWGVVNISNKWGVYQEGVNDNNCFFGTVLIGTDTVSTYKLDVVGSIRASVNINAGGNISATGEISAIGNINALSNITFTTGVGTKLGTATTQKLGFWNVTPITQPTTATAGSAFVANTGTAINSASTFDGYTLAKVVSALRNIGLLA